ncbi:MAG: ATP-dependent Clp protease proteolytic subunit [Actinomycetota bacterium]
MASLLVPTVTEHTPRGDRMTDVYSRLLGERIVFIGTPIDDAVANTVIAQLLHLDADDPRRDVSLVINSPGGVVTSGWGILDTMAYVGPDVATFCVGQAASMAAILLAAGAPGKRYSLPNARILLHQPHGGAEGQTTDIQIAARDMLLMREQMEDLLAERTNQSKEQIAADLERDYILRGQEAVDYGVIDEVIVQRPAPNEVGLAAPRS